MMMGDSQRSNNSSTDRGPSPALAMTTDDTGKGRTNSSDGHQNSEPDKIEVDPAFENYPSGDKPDFSSDRGQTDPNVPAQGAQHQPDDNLNSLKKETSKRRNEASHKSSHDLSQEYPDIHLKVRAREERHRGTSHDDRNDSNANKQFEDDLVKKIEAQVRREYEGVCKEMLEKIEQDRQSLENNQIQLAKWKHGYKRSLATLEENRSEFSRKEQETQDIISKLKSNINELTVSVSKTVNVNGITTRDDDYFEAEFARLGGSIHQWARRSFHPSEALTYSQLPPRLSKLLGAEIPGLPVPYDSKIGSTEFEAIMVHTIFFDMIFKPRFLLPWEGMMEELYNLEQSGENLRPEIASTVQLCLGGTDLKKREWFSQTIGMLFAHNRYEEFFTANIQFAEKILQELSNSLLHLDGEKLEKSAKRLASIISQAAKLHKETFQQVSPFHLHRIRLGDPYNPAIMEELSLLDNEEMGGRHYVQAVLFPPVVRTGFDRSGTLLSGDPVVIRKGVVKCFVKKN